MQANVRVNVRANVRANIGANAGANVDANFVAVPLKCAFKLAMDTKTNRNGLQTYFDIYIIFFIY